MSYRLQETEPLPFGVKRIAFEQIDESLDYLRMPTDDVDFAVHECRKCLKKLRGLLRLVRDEIGEGSYQRENTSFRDAGRLLSQLRDSRVMIQIWESVATADAIPVGEETYRVIEAELEHAYDKTRRETLQEQQALQEAAQMITEARSRVDEWPVEHDDFSAVAGGLRKVYKRGRNRLRDADEEPVAENFHEWRKRVKYLWYGIRILRPIWPEPMTTLATEIHDLSDYLGDEHDLAEFQALVKDGLPEIDDVARYELLAHLQNERAPMQDQAFALGRRIYADTPDAFTARIGAYWRAARR
jgi:CHAD domain-containing protein